MQHFISHKPVPSPQSKPSRNKAGQLILLWITSKQEEQKQKQLLLWDMCYQSWLGTKPDHYLTNTQGTSVPGHCFIFMRSFLCMYREITLKWPTAIWGVRTWIKESLWNPKTWTAHSGKNWSVKTLLRQQQFCCLVILWALFACSLQRRPKPLYSSLAGRGKVVPPTHISIALLHCYYCFDFWTFSISVSVLLPFKSRKGLQCPRCVRHTSR